MREIPAKTIVNRAACADEWFGCDYNMNLYKGCCHGCIYCDSRSEVYGVEDFDEVRVKKDALAIIERELAGKRSTGLIGTGAMSDPYNPFEAELQLTRGSLALIDRFGFGVSMLTKSDLVVRDIDLYQKIARHSPVCVRLTVTTADDALCAKIEPHIVVSSKRFAALKALSSAGLCTGVLLMPLLPFLNDTVENVETIVHLSADAGARFVYPFFGVTLRQNQRAYFYAQLDRLFPGVKERYIKTFGEAYHCASPNAKELHAALVRACGQRGLLYKMEDIIADCKKNYGQTTLF